MSTEPVQTNDYETPQVAHTLHVSIDARGPEEGVEDRPYVAHVVVRNYERQEPVLDKTVRFETADQMLEWVNDFDQRLSGDGEAKFPLSVRASRPSLFGSLNTLLDAGLAGVGVVVQEVSSFGTKMKDRLPGKKDDEGGDGEKTSGVTESLSENVSTVKDSVAEHASQVKDTVAEKLSDTKEVVTDHASQVKEEVASNASDVKEEVAGHAGEVKEEVGTESGDAQETITSKASEIKEQVSPSDGADQSEEDQDDTTEDDQRDADATEGDDQDVTDDDVVTDDSYTSDTSVKSGTPEFKERYGYDTYEELEEAALNKFAEVESDEVTKSNPDAPVTSTDGTGTETTAFDTDPEVTINGEDPALEDLEATAGANSVSDAGVDLAPGESGDPQDVAYLDVTEPEQFGNSEELLPDGGDIDAADTDADPNGAGIPDGVPVVDDTEDQSVTFVEESTYHTYEPPVVTQLNTTVGERIDGDTAEKLEDVLKSDNDSNR